eukprot:jgi/Botrbrau1/17042/Bobra.49_2s0098.1
MPAEKRPTSAEAGSPRLPKRLKTPSAGQPKNQCTDYCDPSTDGIIRGHGNPVSQAEAKSRWPSRYEVSKEDDTKEPWRFAKRHWEAVEVEDVKEGEAISIVRVGDFVEVNSDEDGPEEGTQHKFVIQVGDIYQDLQGSFQVTPVWFYKPWDTFMKVKPQHSKKGAHLPINSCEAWDHRRVWKAAESDNDPDDPDHYEFQVAVAAFDRVITVEQVPPGGEPQGDCDYWYDQEHDRKFGTFIDSFTEVPRASETADNGGQGRVLRVLDLYCGCGGMSFLDQQQEVVRGPNGKEAPGIRIKTCWAVDYMPSMCDTFAVNYPDAKVFNMGVDEFVILCQKVKALSDEYPDDWEEPPSDDDNDSTAVVEEGSDDGSFEVEAIVDVKLQTSVSTYKTGQGKGQYTEALTLENCWLVFQIKWVGYDLGDTEEDWIKADQLSCPERIAQFMKQLRADKRIPLPGDVDLVMGGSPLPGVFPA